MRGRRTPRPWGSGAGTRGGARWRGGRAGIGQRAQREEIVQQGPVPRDVGRHEEQDRGDPGEERKRSPHWLNKLRAAARSCQLACMGGAILIGTQGWNYDAWVGPFYPGPTPPTHYLLVYSR